jgi:type IV secretory pathway VirB10-like protein
VFNKQLKETKNLPDKIIQLHDFIEVKGMKAQGNQLTKYKVKEVLLNHDIQKGKEPWPDEVSDLPEVQSNHKVSEKEKEPMTSNPVKKVVKEKKVPTENKSDTKKKEFNKPEIKRETTEQVKKDNSQKTDESSNTIEWDLTDKKSDDDEQMTLF